MAPLFFVKNILEMICKIFVGKTPLNYAISRHEDKFYQIY